MLFKLITWGWLGGPSLLLYPCTRAREDICTPETPSQRVWVPPSPGEGAVELVPCRCSEPERRGDGAGFVKINKFKEKALNVFPQQL